MESFEFGISGVQEAADEYLDLGTGHFSIMVQAVGSTGQEPGLETMDIKAGKMNVRN